MSDLLDSARDHLEKFGSTIESQDISIPRITKFGEVIVKKGGVEVKDFSTENTPNKGDLPKLVIDWAIEELRNTKTLFTSEPTGIQCHIESIKCSLKEKNWFGALFLSLAMPDICGAIEDPVEGVGKRYTKWFRKYMSKHYTKDLFSADDCYYLRCSTLHQGMAEHPKAKNKRIHFTTPIQGLMAHSNFVEDNEGGFVLQMQIDVFCLQICKAVGNWESDVTGDSEISKRIESLMEFYPPSKPIGA